MNGALDLLSDFIEQPARAASAVRERPSVAPGLLGYLLAALSLFLARKLAGNADLQGAFLFSLLLLCALRLCVGVAHSGIVHLAAEAMGGRGRAVPMFALMGLGELPWALALPGVLLIQAVGKGSGWLLVGLFSLVYALSLCLKARGIRDNYGLTAGKAWLALLLPYLGAAALAAAALTAALAAVFQGLFKLLA